MSWDKPDTLPMWLFYRFDDGRSGDKGKGWNSLPQEDKDYWKHEAEAVRRAVERGGFK